MSMRCIRGFNVKYGNAQCGGKQNARAPHVTSPEHYNLNRNIQTVQNPTQELDNIQKKFADKGNAISVQSLAQRKSEVLSGSQNALVDAKDVLNSLLQKQVLAFKKRDDLNKIKSSIGKMQIKLNAILNNTKIVQDYWSKEIDDASMKVADLQNEINDLKSQVDQQAEVKAYERQKNVPADDVTNNANQFENTKKQIDQAKIDTQDAVKNALDICGEINGLIRELKNLAQQVEEQQKKIKENTERAKELLNTINEANLDNDDAKLEALKRVSKAIEKNQDLLDSAIDVDAVKRDTLEEGCIKLNVLADCVAVSCDAEMDAINEMVQAIKDGDDEELKNLLDDVKSKLQVRERMKHDSVERNDITEIQKEDEQVPNGLNEGLKRDFSDILSAEKLWQDVSIMYGQIEQNSAKLEKVQQIESQLQQPAQLKQALGDLQTLLRYSGFVTIVEDNMSKEGNLEDAMEDADKIDVDYDNF